MSNKEIIIKMNWGDYMLNRNEIEQQVIMQFNRPKYITWILTKYLVYFSEE